MKNPIKPNRSQFHYILLVKGWYDSFAESRDEALKLLHDKVYLSNPAYAKRCLYNQLVGLLDKQDLERVIENIFDDYGVRADWGITERYPNFEDKLTRHIVDIVSSKKIIGENLDILWPQKLTVVELRRVKEGAETFNETYAAFEKVYSEFFVDDKILPTPQIQF